MINEMTDAEDEPCDAINTRTVKSGGAGATTAVKINKRMKMMCDGFILNDFILHIIQLFFSSCWFDFVLSLCDDDKAFIFRFSIVVFRDGSMLSRTNVALSFPSNLCD